VVMTLHKGPENNSAGDKLREKPGMDSGTLLGGGGGVVFSHPGLGPLKEKIGGGRRPRRKNQGLLEKVIIQLKKKRERRCAEGGQENI